MQPKILLRIASILLLLHLVGHTLGHSSWKQAKEPEEKAVISQMTDHTFPFMGSNRSFGDFFDGYGYACSIALALMMTMLWILSSAHLNTIALVRLLTALWIAFFLWSAIEFRYFDLSAALTSLLPGLLTLLASLVQKPKVVPQLK